MEIALAWFFFSVVVGVGASGRGRSGFGWFVLSVLISPLLAVILLALLPSLAKVAQSSPDSLGDRAEKDETRKCPYCAETIKREAIKCRYCGSDIPALAPSASVGPPEAHRDDPIPQQKSSHSKWALPIGIAALAVGWLLSVVVAGYRLGGDGGYRSGSTSDDTSEARNVDYQLCFGRGVSYYRDIGSYPTLSDGSSAEDLIRERCRRTVSAF